jgi:glycosyltransferase involved in cell wall biosynthesis
MKKAIIFGSASFIDGHVKVGINYIAEYLANLGYETHYLSSWSSPLDLFSSSRRTRFKQAWLGKSPVKVRENLWEWIIPVPFPTNKKVWLINWQLYIQKKFIPKYLRENSYDLSIFDTSPTMIFYDSINTKKTIFRLNDIPEGFSYNFPKQFIQYIRTVISENKVDEIVAVSHYLADYAQKLNENTKIRVVPNGVDLDAYKPLVRTVSERPKRAVFVGSISPWVDIDLIAETATLIPDWHFDLFGPIHISMPTLPTNINYQGTLPSDHIPKVLKKYAVGLIPFTNTKVVEPIERPVKYYEYLAAELGIVATDVGGLKKGMRELACYGNGSVNFKNAIEQAFKKRQEEHWSIARFELLRDVKWKDLVKEIISE